MKMTEDELLSILETEGDDAELFNSGQLAQDRTQSMRDYMRLPYGNEEAGRSSVISSDVFDAVEGMLPDLIEVFAGTDEAVRFDPVSAEDEEGAQQATDGCNYVFYKQNNGFFILYTAAKDALSLKTGGVKWWWEEKRTPTFTTYKDIDEMQLAMYLIQNPKAEVLEKEEQEVDPNAPPQADQMGQPMPALRRYTVKIKTVETKGKVCVKNFPPDELLVAPRHASPLLEDCPYVAHLCLQTLSDIHQMGFADVTVDDVKAAQSERVTQSADRQLRDSLTNRFWEESERTDDAMVKGWLREEYVLVDFDGDGIAERRRVLRLGKKILSNDECSHVQIAAWTPYLLTHQFHGISVADLVTEFQRANTEIWRQSLDNAYQVNNQEMVVLSDKQGNPQANIDDLLNRKPGGLMREYQPGAIRPLVERWAGMEVLPMVEYMASAKENRTGYTRYSQGLDANSLNQTAHGIQQIMNASQKRMKLMARIMAEALVAPMFKGIFKTLTDYSMEELSFRLHNKFVKFDPQTWRDGYDMTINVGIGAGDKTQQMQMLGGIEAAQMAAVQGGGMGVLVDPTKIYNLQKRKVQLAGFKDAGEFWLDPAQTPPKPPQPPPPDPTIQKTQMQLEGDAQKAQFTSQQEAMKTQATLQHASEEAQKQRDFDYAMKQLEMASKVTDAPMGDEAADQEQAAQNAAALAHISSALQVLLQATMAPKRVIFNEQGRPVGVEPVLNND